MSLRRNILNGLASGGFGVFVTLLTQLLLVPIFLAYWGEERYAIWLVIFAVPTYLSVTDLGFINVLTNKALRFFSLGREQVGTNYIFSAFAFIVPISFMLSTLIYFCFCMLLPDKFTTLSLGVYFFLVFYSSLLLVSNLIVGSFRAIRLFHIGSFGVNFLRLVDLLVILFTLTMYRDELFMAIFLSFFRLIGVCILSYTLMQGLNTRKAFVSSKLIYLNLKSSLNYFLIPMSSMAMNQGVLMIVGINFLPKAIIIFNSLRILFRMMTLVTSVFINAFRQEVSRLYYRNDKKYFYLMKKLLIVNVSLTVLFSAFYIVFGELVLKLWLGVGFTYNQYEFYLILLFVAINNLNLNNFMVVNSTNKHDAFSIKNFYVTILFIGVFVMVNEFYLLLLTICTYEIIIFIITYLTRQKVECSVTK
jgi:O-antigen/teichoic acid export membrane protein